MTTIAHKDGIIACDSQCTEGEMIYSLNVNKIFKRKDGVVFVVAGDSSYYERVVEEYPDFTFDANVTAFVYDNGKVIRLCSDGEKLSLDPEFPGCHNALGTGKPYAIAAMDCGLSAVDAVKVAIKRDIYSGGKVRWVKVG